MGVLEVSAQREPRASWSASPDALAPCSADKMGQNDQDKNDNAGSQSAKANSMSGDQDKKKDADSQLPTPQDGKIQDKQDKSKDPNLQTPTSPDGKAQDDQEKKKDADSQPSKPKSGTNAIFQFHTSKEAKQWAKKYRTEIAASTSSVLSTFVAFPLDFAKSRMQSYKTGFAPAMGWHLESSVLAAGFASWPCVLQLFSKFAVGWTFTYKCFNGMRHLIWDTATMMTNKQVTQSGWFAVGASALSALALCFL